MGGGRWFAWVGLRLAAFTAMYIIIIIVVLVAGKMRLWMGSG